MRILVAYASRYGATEGIARRIAEVLSDAGHRAETLPLNEARDLSGYEAFVVGSAVYFGTWLKGTEEFVRRNADVLASRPTWLFSSGPLGAKPTDEKGRDLRESATPKEIAELSELIHPRGHRVFFGALFPSKLRLRDRLIRALPAGRGLLPEGDFRNWPDIEAWASNIASTLAQTRAEIHPESPVP